IFRRRVAQTSMFALLIMVIVGLLGWINQSVVTDQLNWYRTTRPYMVANVRPYVLTPATEGALKPGDTFRECAKICPEMIVVRSGSFNMGSPSDRGRADERPLHPVAIPKAIAMSRYVVTFDDWDACVVGGGCGGYEPDAQGWGRGQRPVINVNWH